MAFPSKPGLALFSWTDGAPAKISDPGAAKKLLGWVANERPPFEFFNFTDHVAFEWLQYFESVTDQLIAQALYFDAIVGSAGGATHATLQDAVNDGSLATNVVVLVTESAALASTQVMTKADWEVIFKPGVTYSESGAGTGIQISASGIRIVGGRFADFSGGGERAILIDAGSDFTNIHGSRFSNNTDDVVDNNGNTSITGVINE